MRQLPSASARRPARAPIGRVPRARSPRLCCPTCPTLATLSLRPRAHSRCETAGGARGAAAPSIGVKGLLPRAPWWWKRHRERAHGASWQTLPPRPPKQRCARTQLSRASIIGRLSLVVYPTGTAFSRYERTLPAPCSMPIRTHNIGVYSYHRHAGAVSGHTYAVLDLPSALRQCALS